VTKKDAIAQFALVMIDQTDPALIREAWAAYVDALRRLGDITDYQSRTWVNPVKKAKKP